MNIFRILLSDQLRNLDGFELQGTLKISKGILAASLKDRLKAGPPKPKEEKKEFNLFSAEEFGDFMKHMEIRELNVFFEEDEICFRIDIKKD